MNRHTSGRDASKIWLRKRDAIKSRRVKALNQLVEQLRKTHRGVPWFDPCDGGKDARVLLLLESPGPEAEENAFVSRENDDPTARCVAVVFDGVGIDRRQMVAWNVVPWPRRSLKVDDLREAAPCTIKLLGLLPKLRAVVLMGNKALRAWAEVEPLLGKRRLMVHFAPHPAKKAMNRPGFQERLRAVARRVKMLHC